MAFSKFYNICYCNDKAIQKIYDWWINNKIEEIKRNINLSLESFTIAEKKMNEATKSTEDLEFKITD